MTEEQTISWVFLSIAIASEIHPADFRGISMIGDGINHAVPTHKELLDYLSWNFILVDRKRFSAEAFK